ncbi:hypothetical protein SDJN02_08015 [Cucurbita argyrosperma subsp. argyrosperma]|nr:hypothetical protein SDJN02_08015 [Cucurbita argyrosperma subsp. argyrosperma]
MELHYYSHRNQSQRAALAGVFLVLFPIIFPRLFDPLGRASPSLFSTLEDQREIWSPLPNQGWKPCLKPTKAECEYYDFGLNFEL